MSHLEHFHADLANLAEAEARLQLQLAGLTDAQAREASALPGWSRGHLLTHLARNADSHVRRCQAAAEGRSTTQYEGGTEGRAAQIEAGAARSAAALLADVASSSAAMLEAFWAVTPEALGVVSTDSSGTERELATLPRRRWQEVEVHLVDLDLGVEFEDWPERFVDTFLPIEREALPSRLVDTALVVEPSLPPRLELAWYYGRLDVEGLPELTPWR